MDPANPGQYGGYQAPPPIGGGGSGIAMAKVSGPAIGLMITAGVGICLHILGILVRLLGFGMMGAMEQESRLPVAVGGVFGVVIGAIGIILCVVVLLGAMKMKNLESYGFAMAAAIIAIIPCTSCYLIGIPIGIWAIVVLVNPDVKAAFRS